MMTRDHPELGTFVPHGPKTEAPEWPPEAPACRFTCLIPAGQSAKAAESYYYKAARQIRRAARLQARAPAWAIRETKFANCNNRDLLVKLGG